MNVPEGSESEDREVLELESELDIKIRKRRNAIELSTVGKFGTISARLLSPVQAVFGGIREPHPSATW
ncbi:hypothetical protein M427DRAFT_52210 [Gonapodya prolifera JEL478]|uniref:Uncharacterized protein n=1 Tax=Gonapodya prolifera (strain JEL478) TaxID=1344416 RepID=A0A139AV65_GONPJ|nr:hypothetical protein M427DRAFT_52210 [Gonapodya prolifera JEL478]|eukprot:KXS20622.1 hypothetical protein M427DRAFT_52210 [Gonapodya prolifera JEL478]